MMLELGSIIDKIPNLGYFAAVENAFILLLLDLKMNFSIINR